MAQPKPANANPDDRPEDLKTAWIDPARPQWEALLLAVSHNKRIFLRVGRYNKDTQSKKWLGIELAPSSLRQLVKEGEASLKLIKEA